MPTTNTVTSTPTALAETPAQKRRAKEAATHKAARAKELLLKRQGKAKAAAKAKKAKHGAVRVSLDANQKAHTLSRQPMRVTLRKAAAGAGIMSQKATAVMYGAARRYAEYLSLDSELGEGWEAWTADTPTNPNEVAHWASINGERKAYQAECKDRGHSNPSVAWGQVKKAAATVLDTNGKAQPKDGTSRGPSTSETVAERAAKRVYVNIGKLGDNATPKQLELSRLSGLILKLLGVNLTPLNDKIV